MRSAEPILLGNMYLIMLFKGILSYTGVIGLLPDFIGQFPISMTMSFGLLFFIGTVISGSPDNHCSLHAHGVFGVSPGRDSVSCHADECRVGCNADISHPRLFLCCG